MERSYRGGRSGYTLFEMERERKNGDIKLSKGTFAKGNTQVWSTLYLIQLIKETVVIEYVYQNTK